MFYLTTALSTWCTVSMNHVLKASTEASFAVISYVLQFKYYNGINNKLGKILEGRIIICKSSLNEIDFLYLKITR